MIKFKRSLSDFQYCLSFDLAKAITGWSLVDFRNNRIIQSGVINTTKDPQTYIWKQYRDEIRKVFIYCYGIVDNSKIFVTKEKLPNQAGKFSTAATLQALAQAHAVFDLCLIDSGFEYYDLDGVHSISEKAYFRKISGIEKPQKEDICNEIKKIFSEDLDKILNYDVSDSIAVTLTLINHKWNDDIYKYQRDIKRESKTFKTDKKKSELKELIQNLEGLKI